MLALVGATRSVVALAELGPNFACPRQTRPADRPQAIAFRKRSRFRWVPALRLWRDRSDGWRSGAPKARRPIGRLDAVAYPDPGRSSSSKSLQPDRQSARRIESIREGIEGDEGSSPCSAGPTAQGKTMTMAARYEAGQRPSLADRAQKTLAEQLCNESGPTSRRTPSSPCLLLRSYQPEAYCPVGRILLLEKDTAIHRRSTACATRPRLALLRAADVIIVASVSCILAWASPETTTSAYQTHQARGTSSTATRLLRTARIQPSTRATTQRSGVDVPRSRGKTRGLPGL